MDEAWQQLAMAAETYLRARFGDTVGQGGRHKKPHFQQRAVAAPVASKHQPDVVTTVKLKKTECRSASVA